MPEPAHPPTTARGTAAAALRPLRRHHWRSILLGAVGLGRRIGHAQRRDRGAHQPLQHPQLMLRARAGRALAKAAALAAGAAGAAGALQEPSDVREQREHLGKGEGER